MTSSCFHLLQQNLSDVLFYPRRFPFYRDGITEALQISHGPIEILSAYNCSIERSQEESRIEDVMDSVKSFDPSLWFSIVFTLLIFAALIYFHNRNHPGKKCANPIWTIVAFFFEYGSILEFNYMTRLLVAILTFFIFMIETYYKNLVSTDLVSITPPIVMRSYQDVTNSQDIIPKLWSEVEDFKCLREASSVSGAGRLWEKMKRIGLTNTMVIVDSSPEMMELGNQFSRFKAVWIMYKINMRLVRLVSCAGISGLGICTHLSIDQDQPFDHFEGFIGREDFVNRFRKKLNWRRIFDESGLIEEHVKKFPQEATRSIFGMSIDLSSDCLMDTIVIHPPESNSVGMPNLYKLLKLSSLLVMVSIVFSLYEIALGCYNEQKRLERLRRKKRRKMRRKKRKERKLHRIPEKVFG